MTIIINPYSRFALKDSLKFKHANKLIAFSFDPNSSTYKYAKDNPLITNLSNYNSNDIVGVSLPGANRKEYILSYLATLTELELVIEAKASIIQDANTTQPGGAFSYHNRQTEGKLYEFIESLDIFTPTNIYENGVLVGTHWVYKTT